MTSVKGPFELPKGVSTHKLRTTVRVNYFNKYVTEDPLGLC